MPKRKKAFNLDPDILVKYLEAIKSSVNEAFQQEGKDNAQDAFNQTMSELQDLVLEAVQPSSLKRIPASTMSLYEVCSRTGLKYEYHNPAHHWDLTENNTGDVAGTHWMRAALQDIFQCSSVWVTEGCEAMVRTRIDIVLFDRLKFLSATKGEGFRRLKVVGEYNIRAVSLDGDTVIEGQCDYAIGYGSHDPRRLESAFIAIEAKATLTPSAIPQLFAYLVAIQQMRKNQDKCVKIVYGIITDGNTYQFARLGSDMSVQLSQALAFGHNHQSKIFAFIDLILDSAIQCSPHTTLERSFVPSEKHFTSRIEAIKLNLPSAVINEVDPSDEEMEVCDIVMRNGKLEIVPHEKGTSS